MKKQILLIAIFTILSSTLSYGQDDSYMKNPDGTYSVGWGKCKK